MGGARNPKAGHTMASCTCAVLAIVSFPARGLGAGNEIAMAWVVMHVVKYSTIKVTHDCSYHKNCMLRSPAPGPLSQLLLLRVQILEPLQMQHSHHIHHGQQTAAMLATRQRVYLSRIRPAGWKQRSVQARCVQSSLVRQGS